MDTETLKRWNALVLLVMLALVVHGMIAERPWATVFAVAVTAFNVLRVVLAQPGFDRAGAWLVFGGGSLNMLAVVSNGGQMPVLGKVDAAARWWKPLDPDSVRFYWLCDIFAGCSVGDMLIGFSLPFLAVAFVLERERRRFPVVAWEAELVRSPLPVSSVLERTESGRYRFQGRSVDPYRDDL